MEDSAIRLEAARLRLLRAEQQRGKFAAENASQLLEEIEPQAVAVRERLAKALQELLDADAAWHSVYAAVTQILVDDPTASPRFDLAVEEHVLTRTVREARTASRSGVELARPWPHFRHREQVQDSNLRARLAKLVGKEGRSSEEEAEVKRLKDQVEAA